MGVENYLITSSLVAMLAQRLVRVICKDCNSGGSDARNAGALMRMSDLRGRGRTDDRFLSSVSVSHLASNDRPRKTMVCPTLEPEPV
jgi:type II secretory ATPase GspE/PulE/Tfp pilus assembly ATPase PilB-like protein